MSNLGGYQEIVTLAKRAEGVDNFISIIEARGAFEAAPRQIGTGIAIGATLVCAIVVGRLLWTKSASINEAAAAEAAAHLNAVIVDAESEETKGDEAEK